MKEELIQEFGENPFIYDLGMPDAGYQPEDPRLDVRAIVRDWTGTLDADTLSSLTQAKITKGSNPDTCGCFQVELSKTESVVGSGDALPARSSLAAQFVLTCEDVNRVTWPKDEWKKGFGCWIRVRNRPRRAMFTPTGTLNGPDVALLSGAAPPNLSFAMEVPMKL